MAASLSQPLHSHSPSPVSLPIIPPLPPSPHSNSLDILCFTVQADRTGGLETALKAMNSLRGVVTLVRGKGGGGGEKGRGGWGLPTGEGMLFM